MIPGLFYFRLDFFAYDFGAVSVGAVVFKCLVFFLAILATENKVLAFFGPFFLVN